jgi:carbamoyl-phosphate synthase large subunit
MENIRKVIILGSGGLKIGQAGEFDYSGSQAIKALKEEGVFTILINPNIATYQTSQGVADSIYFLPITPEFVEEVIEKERPDGILLAFGGQTALNCGVALEDAGILEKHDVKVLGTTVAAIQKTEDRDLFVQALDEVGVDYPKSIATSTVEEAVAAAQKIGYPVMVRVAYALGGKGSGICTDEQHLVTRCREAFSATSQVLVEEWLGGWKEVEYEVVRDKFDNCITVCNMENFDPLGIHTGESIVVAPSQTLTNNEYHKLRSIAIAVIKHLGVVGECNIQYALDPHSEEYRIIEVNARLSRSSALASKATGYPLAFIAAKLALGHSLMDIPNKITKKTMACFEPALDYVVVKMPRWDLKKFKQVDQRIGTEMKSVGEVMSIGRSFEEALQKSLRMLAIGVEGVLAEHIPFTDLRQELQEPTDKRIFSLAEACKRGWTVEQLYEETKIDKWFLYKMEKIVNCAKKIQKSELTHDLLLHAKQLGFSDKQIGQFLEKKEHDIRYLRKHHGVIPVIKQIDTLAAEYPAQTNYLYLTYNGSEHDVAPSTGSIAVLGSGSYRIGSSVEFDWCCVNAIIAAKQLGHTTLMINCNPETVSTDYDVCDKLYFEEITYERVLDIYEFERPHGVIVSMGGQIPNNLALPLSHAGVSILGTSPEQIDRAENRHTFSQLLDSLEIDQPAWKELSTIEEAKLFAQRVGYPVLIRPSYVLSGAAMNVVWDDESLLKYLGEAADVNPEHPVVITKFIENSKEIELDAVAKNGEILIYAISEHIENAGIHSGDATMMLPAQRLYIETIRKIKKIARKIAEALQITGPFNIQFLAYHNKVRVIECNLRASRSFPFCSKVFKHNFIDYATRAILGAPVSKVEKSSLDLEYVGVKAAQFSFSRLKGADPVLGVEMASTGEVACLGTELNDAFMKALISSGMVLPAKNILLSTGPVESKAEFLESARSLYDLGYKLFASPGTAAFLITSGVPVQALRWPLEQQPNMLDKLKEGKMDLVINIPKNNQQEELTNGYLIRRTAIDFDIPLITDIKIARQFVDALVDYKIHGLEVKAWNEY